MTPEARRQILATIGQLQSLLDSDADGQGGEKVTVADLWARYMLTLPDAQWTRSRASSMKPFLATVPGLLATELRQAHWENFRDAPETRKRFAPASRNAAVRRRCRACARSP